MGIIKLKIGDRLISEGFGCIPSGEERTVESGYRGGLYIRCNCGRHYLGDDLKGLRLQLHDEPYRPSTFSMFFARLFGLEISTTARRMPRIE